jgi:hypothetical protein
VEGKREVNFKKERTHVYEVSRTVKFMEKEGIIGVILQGFNS